MDKGGGGQFFAILFGRFLWTIPYRSELLVYLLIELNTSFLSFIVMQCRIYILIVVSCAFRCFALSEY